ncbi:biliverdin-producing heme oxygenase [Dongia mobilis]|nr:biliverdin-producing heme oxygenase [Dongia mobilis]
MVIETSPGRVADGATAAAGLCDLMRQHTRELHMQAERSGIIRELLQRRADRLGHGLHLRNLLPAYKALEANLERHSGHPVLGEVRQPALYRGAAILSDLVQLFGPDWEDRLPLLDEAVAYAKRIDAATEADPARLLAHAYVRYLGDLNGGRILRDLMAKALELDDSALSYFAFPQLGNSIAAAADLRAILDQAGSRLPDQTSVIDEAAVAFRLSIGVSEAVKAAAIQLAARAGE